MSAPASQVSQLTSHWPNNEQKSHLTPTALEKEHVEHLRVETIFPPDLDNNDIQSSIL